MIRLLPALLWLAFAAGSARGQDAARAEELRRQAADAEQAGDVVEAEALLRAALDADVDHVPSIVALGRLLQANEGGAEGVGLLYRAIQLDPNSEEATVALVDALLEEHDWYFGQGDSGNADSQLARAAEALDRLEKAAGTPSDDVARRRVRVLMKSEEGGEHAFSLASSLVARHPDDQELHALLVDAATAAGAFDSALAFYEQAELEPWLDAWFTAATYAARATAAYNRYGDDEQVVKDYLAADELILAAGRMNEAVFAAASERSSYYRSWAGWTRMEHQRLYDEAWELFVSAWGREPTNENAIEGMRRVAGHHYETGELEKSRDLNRQLCMLRPDVADYWNDFALLSRDTGQFEQSYQAYRRAMELAPDDARIVNDCALILQYHLHRDLDLAERWLIRAEDLAGAALARATDAQDDAAIAEHKLVLGDALANLARLYADQGRMQESAEHWNELRAVDPTRDELPENAR